MADRNRTLLYFASGVLCAGAASALYTLLSPERPKALISPVDLYKRTSPAALRRLPYPPIDFIPGARDVPTPYGTIRMYEWGPEEGQRKVLLLHGISGSCVVLLTLAETLASEGCRVLLLDLFGRGWSGGPHDLPYDGRLYASQIFMSLASSPVPWTAGGHGRFTIIGYSLGGGLAADFASYFPDMIEDLVLIAPGGLMTSDWRSRLLYSGLVPESRMKEILRGRLLGAGAAASLQTSLGPDLADEEGASKSDPSQSFLEKVKNVDADAIVAWQLNHNPGFVPGFVSSIRLAPTKNQQHRWRLIGDHIRSRKSPGALSSFTSRNVLLVLGGQDSIITPAGIVPEATKVLGEDQVKVAIFEDAGHSVGMSHGVEIANLLLKRWRF